MINKKKNQTDKMCKFGMRSLQIYEHLQNNFANRG